MGNNFLTIINYSLAHNFIFENRDFQEKEENKSDSKTAGIISRACSSSVIYLPSELKITFKN